MGRVRFQFVQCCILADWTLCIIIVQKRVFDCIISWILLYSKRVNSRIDINPASNTGNVAAYDQFQDQRSIERYVRTVDNNVSCVNVLSSLKFFIKKLYIKHTLFGIDTQILHTRIHTDMAKEDLINTLPAEKSLQIGKILGSLKRITM